MPTTYFDIGDWSDDGHGKYTTMLVAHNLENDKDLVDANKRGENIVGVSFSEMCDEYEQGYLTYEQFHQLQPHIEDMEHFVNIPENWDDKYDKPYFQEGPNSFLELWLTVAKIGNPDLEFNIRDISQNSIKIGGYGLFY